MSLFDHQEFDGHEQVVYCHDRSSGLSAIIAVHDTRLGPALGGCRMFPYADDAAALYDVLRLSRGMTYKSALAGLPLGGGKSVIIGDPFKDKNEAMIRAMGQAIDRLGGRYIGAEDSGTGVADLKLMAQHTAHVAGIKTRRTSAGERDGDPSPSTAYGVYCGLRAALAHQRGSDALDGVRIAIQGLGNVGLNLAKRLHAAGARLWVSDTRADRLSLARSELGAVVVAPEAIHAQDVDVFAPCAMGAILNDSTIPSIRARIVAGASNNQLEQPRHALQLQQQGILYAPDYVINAGGIIDVWYERSEGPEAEEQARIEAIGSTLIEIFRQAEASGRTTAEVADELARRRIEAVARRRVTQAA